MYCISTWSFFTLWNRSIDPLCHFLHEFYDQTGAFLVSDFWVHVWAIVSLSPLYQIFVTRSILLLLPTLYQIINDISKIILYLFPYSSWMESIYKNNGRINVMRIWACWTHQEFFWSRSRAWFRFPLVEGHCRVPKMFQELQYYLPFPLQNDQNSIIVHLKSMARTTPPDFFSVIMQKNLNRPPNELRHKW